MLTRWLQVEQVGRIGDVGLLPGEEAFGVDVPGLCAEGLRRGHAAVDETRAAGGEDGVLQQVGEQPRQTASTRPVRSPSRVSRVRAIL